MTVLLVIAGAAIGAPLRYVVSLAFNQLLAFPWGTLAVNVSGAAALGFTVGTSSGSPLQPGQIFAVAFCGAFTTYSAFAVETAELGWVRGAIYAGVTVAAGLAAAAMGLAVC